MKIAKILDYLENIIQADCDICPCQTVSGDYIECSKENNETCREMIKRNLFNFIASSGKNGNPLKTRKIKVKIRKCQVCGCSQMNGCFEGCSWAEKHLCSKCAERKLK